MNPGQQIRAFRLKQRLLILGILAVLLLMLVVGPVLAAPNLVPKSNQFNTWTGANTNRVPNVTTAYDNSTRGWSVAENTNTGVHNFYPDVPVITSGQNYTVTIYAKEGTTRYIQAPLGSRWGENYTNYDLHGCTVAYTSPSLISSAESVANGWCRVRVTAKAINSGIGYVGYTLIRSPLDTRQPSYAGSASNYSYFYGEQVEIGDTVSTYNATSEYPEASIIPSTTGGISPLSVTLTDNTTPSQIVSWAWYAINQSNSSPEYAIATTQNPSYTFRNGNWTVKLKASNYLYSGNSSLKWINVSQAADTTPPDSINTLTATEITCNSINWTWANPSDPDFNGTMMYINNVFSQNASKSATWAFTQSLQENKEYTLSTHTFDTSWNLNTTWVNLTVMTTRCTPAVQLAASFVANATCGITPFNVLFNDTSVGTDMTSWYWMFGDGNTSTLKDGNNTYRSAGLFNINHSVTNASGSISWKNESNYIMSLPIGASCNPSGGNCTAGYAYQIPETPIEPAIPIIAVIATLFIISSRRE